MLSEKTIKELVSTPAFLSNASKLAYMLHIPRQDASQELLLELLDHRLHKWSDKDVRHAVQRDQQNLKWKIKYAAKDYYRRISKDATRELEKAQMVSHMTRQASNEAETLEALKLLELFSNKVTKSWVGSVLRVGKQETMIQFHQSPRQFNSKLSRVCKYARQHQHQQPKQSNSNAKELHILTEWDDLMADPDTDDNCIQAFVNSHQDYINEIVDSPLIKFQGKLLKNFVSSGVDRYAFNELMHARYIKLEQELKESK